MINYFIRTFRINFLFLLAACCVASLSYAQQPYVTIWKTDNEGVSGDNQIRFNAVGEFSYEWHDTVNPSIMGSGSNIGEIVITFPQAGVYQLSVTPAGSTPFSKSAFDINTNPTVTDSRKLLEVKQWGDVVWSSFQYMFSGAENLKITATDYPELSQVTDMGGAFNRVTFSSIPNLNGWNMSQVTNMFSMFAGAKNFNQDISNWDVGKVKSFNQMFSEAYRFNQDISAWDVREATDMSYMFSYAESFDQDLGDWNLENLQSAYAIFTGSAMSCTNYSQTLQGWADNSNTASNVNMTDSYENNPVLQPITYNSTFSGRNHLVNDLHWIISGDQEGDCSATTPTEAYITLWQTDNEGITGHDQINFLTDGAFSYEWQDVDNIANTGSGTGHSGETTLTFPQPGKYRLEIFPKSNHPFNWIYFNTVADNVQIKSDARKLLEVIQWGDIKWSSFSQAYNGAQNLTFTVSDIPDLTETGSFRNAFGFTAFSSIPNLPDWDMYNVADMSYMFQGNPNFNQNIGSWNVGKVTTMASMFSNASEFNQNIGGWDVSKTNNMSGMFYGAKNFNQPIGNWQVSNVANMSRMFSNASDFNQNIGNWDVSKVTSISLMFEYAKSFNQNINGWDVSNVKNMSGAFRYASNFNQPLNSWNVSQVTDMSRMFEGNASSQFNQDISGWNVSKVKNIQYMFQGLIKFNQNLGSWQMNDLVNAANAFNNSGMNCVNYSLTLKGWADNPTTAQGVNFSNNNRTYSPDVAAERNYLINDLGWTISGDQSGDCSIVMPLDLIHFTARNQENNTVLLRWQTASESNSAGIDIERATEKNSGAFTRVGYMPASGNSSQTRSYQFVDEMPEPGVVNLYRLKMIDTDGNYSYSDIKFVNLENANTTLTVYPNPAANQITVESARAGKLNLYNGQGVLVKTVQLEAGKNAVNIQSLPSGAYFGEISGQRVRFIKN